MADVKTHRDSLPYQPVPLAELERAASLQRAALPYLLAVKFNYDVSQGGFAQLLYNLRGEFLADIEDMLIVAGATIAHAHYVRAITICLDDKLEYSRFLASNYVDANNVKHALQLLSVEYLQQETDFSREAAVYLESCGRP